jgi:hypothetical protein
VSLAPKLQVLGFHRCAKNDCLWVRREDGHVQLAYVFVDDLVFGGDDEDATRKVLEQFRTSIKCTEAVWMPKKVLGLELKYLPDLQIIAVTMEAKIKEAASFFEVNVVPTWSPIPPSLFVAETQNLAQDAAMGMDAKADQEKYMALVGLLIWIAGLRFDISFAVMYLSWFTRDPRLHHMKCAEHVVRYLVTTSAMPLLLGGPGKLGVVGEGDASLGTAPKGRSVHGYSTRLGELSGVVSAKSKAAVETVIAIFEAELGAATMSVKEAFKAFETVTEWGFEWESMPRVLGDNAAVADFIEGRGMAKGVRHMRLRQWYLRENYQMSRYLYELKPGMDLTADILTKLNGVADHGEKACKLMGLKLIDIDNLKELNGKYQVVLEKYQAYK